MILIYRACRRGGISPGKGQKVNILDFTDHTISIVTVELCLCRAKVAIVNTEMNGHGMFIIYMYLHYVFIYWVPWYAYYFSKTL